MGSPFTLHGGAEFPRSYKKCYIFAMTLHKLIETNQWQKDSTIKEKNNVLHVRFKNQHHMSPVDNKLQ